MSAAVRPSPTAPQSALYVGRVTHTRTHPVPHAFRFGLHMLYLDLDEVDGGFARQPLLSTGGRRALMRFHRRDYLGPHDRPLDEAVRDQVERALGRRPRGPVRLLTQVRTLGYVFNPVTFYYCFDADGVRPSAVVAEITNTPWGERHVEVVDLARSSTRRFPKPFHVSPFMPMALTWDWRFTAPGKGLAVRMQNLRGGQRFFEARLAMRRVPLTTRTLLRSQILRPLLTFRITTTIYWHALRLWLKRCPFHAHPRRASAAVPGDPDVHTQPVEAPARSPHRPEAPPGLARRHRPPRRRRQRVRAG